MRRRVAFASALLLAATGLAGVYQTAAAQDSSTEGAVESIFLLTEETDFVFVTRDGMEIGEDDEFILELTAELSGANELDPVTEEPGVGDPDGSGTATIELREDGSLCWSIEVQNIVLPAIGAHIHEGAADENGPIVVPLGNPNASGVSISCVTPDPAVVDAIAQNPANYYVNIHTSDFQAGAIRGQLGGGFPAVGDRFFSREDAFLSDAEGNKGERIGHVLIECTFGIGANLQCSATGFVDGLGQVHLTANLNVGEEETEPFDVAIVGGTGAFRDAGGDATLTPVEPTSPEAPAQTRWEVRLLSLDSHAMEELGAG